MAPFASARRRLRAPARAGAVILAVGVGLLGSVSQAGASSSAIIAVAAPQVPPAEAVEFMCPAGSKLCLAPANTHPGNGTVLRLLNIRSSQSNRTQAGWILNEFATVSSRTIHGVTNQWLNAHRGWGIYAVIWANDRGLCLGKPALRSPRPTVSHDCNFSWVWRSGHEAFLFYGSPAASKAPIRAPFCLSIFGQRARSDSQISLALVGEAPVQKWVMMNEGII